MSDADRMRLEREIEEVETAIAKIDQQAQGLQTVRMRQMQTWHNLRGQLRALVDSEKEA